MYIIFNAAIIIFLNKIYHIQIVFGISQICSKLSLVYFHVYSFILKVCGGLYSPRIVLGFYSGYGITIL